MCANFLKALRKNLDTVNRTMKLPVVFSLKPNWIWIRDTSCFCSVFIIIFEKIRVAKAGMNVN